ncbi:MAG: ABC transporter permease [Candidatus Fermentibacteraceae bacterium]|nr:ABC transporter permease [Candidatus Fermentibacteraceae bacterium]
MGLISKLAWRNIFRQKRRTILTILTMTGGFVLSSLAIGWANGSYSGMILFFTNHRTGQIQLHKEGYLNDPSIYDTIDDYRQTAEQLSVVDGVRAWAPRIYAGALLAFREKDAPAGVFSNSAASSVIGIDPLKEQAATDFSEQITSGGMLTASPADSLLGATGQILLGEGLAITLDAAVGDSLILLSQAVDGSSADRRYIVTGIVSTGNAEVDRATCYLTLADAQLLFALENRVHELAVVTTSLGVVEKTAAEIELITEPSGLSTSTWKEFAKEFYNGMQADVASLKIILAIIIAVAALGVLNTILMMVLERRREFGVMKAIGTQPKSIVRMIVLEANVMGLASIVLGSIVSTIGLVILSKHGMTIDPPLDYGGFMFREMRAAITFASYWIPSVCVMVTASVVSLVPALKAAHTDAARSLRTV